MVDEVSELGFTHASFACFHTHTQTINHRYGAKTIHRSRIREFNTQKSGFVAASVSRKEIHLKQGVMEADVKRLGFMFQLAGGRREWGRGGRGDQPGKALEAVLLLTLTSQKALEDFCFLLHVKTSQQSAGFKLDCYQTETYQANPNLTLTLTDK